jgi:P pilus assembly chaperone PapD
MCIVHHILKGERFMKKLLRVICSSLLVLAMCAPVYAAASESVLPIKVIGTIISEGDGRIVVQSEYSGNDVIVLNITPDTAIVDSNTGAAAGLDSRTGNYVTVFYDPNAVSTDPEMIDALAVTVNGSLENDSVHYANVKQVLSTDNGVTMLVTAEGLEVTIDTDAAVIPYLAKYAAPLGEITTGTQLLLWYDAVLESFPASTSANVAVIVGRPPAPPAPVLPEGDPWPGEGNDYNGMLENKPDFLIEVPTHDPTYYIITSN